MLTHLWSPERRNDWYGRSSKQQSPYPRHRSIVAVDIEGFGACNKTLPQQLAIRAGLYQAVRGAFTAMRVPLARCHYEDRGDGIFILVPAEYSKTLLTEVLPTALAARIAGHNWARPPQEILRVRLALHAGEVAFDTHGATSTAITFTFRLLESQELKAALATSPGSLALITSTWFFDEVVRNSPASRPQCYRPVRVSVKETTAPAWLTLPDVAEPGLIFPAARPPNSMEYDA